MISPILKKAGLVLSLLLCVCLTASAQKKAISGTITDSVTQKPVSWASILSVMNGNIVLSKKDGGFIVDASEGQILAFSANGYYSDTLTVSKDVWEKGTLLVRLKPIRSTLEGVTVTAGIHDEYQQDSIERRRYFLQTIGENKIPVVGRANDLGFGIAFNLDHYSKIEKNKRQARSLFDLVEETAYVNFRWEETLVEKYTGFSDEALADFMQKARPTYSWLRKHTTTEDLVYYINSQLKKMRKDKKNE